MPPSEKDEPIVPTSSEKPWQEWVRKKIAFYVSTSKWDNVTITQLDAWLANFNSEGEKYALALLNHFIYYSEVDVKRLCLYALTNVVFRDHLLNADRSSNFCCRNDMLLSELKSRIRETRLVPLLSEGNPTESGNAVARWYTTTGFIPESQVIPPDQILPYISRGACKRFLFVDDLLGSGDQLVRFWNEPSISIGISGKRSSLAKIAGQHSAISFEYVALVATTYGLGVVRRKTPNLKVHFCEQLSDDYRVFSKNSIFFQKPEEREACSKYINALCRSKNIPARGFQELDFAIAFHHGVPDSCLPIFWEESDKWTPLFLRRM